MKKIFLCFKQISKCDTCFYMHFSKTFQNYSFRSVALVTKKMMGNFRFFFTHWTFLRSVSVPYPIKLKEKHFLTRNALN